MLVDGTGSKVAAAGQRHVRPAEPTQQSTHQIVAGPHLLDQICVGLYAGDLRAVDLQHMHLRAFHLGAHFVQDLRNDPDIGNIRHIFNTALSLDQQSCRNNGYCRIFRTADGNGAV